jgi:hypothetical protein
MLLNYLSFATLPLPRMGRDFLLSQDENSIYRYFSLLSGESLTINGNSSASFLYAFLGEFEAFYEPADDEEHTVEAGGIIKIPRGVDQVRIIANSDLVLYHVDQVALDKLVAWAEVSRQITGNLSAAGTLNLLMNFSSLKSLPVDSMFELSQRMSEIEVNSGDDIVVQGD